ncbi:non-ribosomal peptide synthetase [Spongiactinospora sp. TRM90649]|uniref:non-ribosomal peptide synthetase n=1 Tax=Spongiactinospora sp. TRM90649 TaxID=3031114 RepID=UPI0023F78F4C|nr:non-ribosomal peptide synthetase [Spongiactinospora sp. TRM90649]MDF5755248.1 amino acid adenylation domain-containing protein [Spongiactinospora sp. TRM90649]
MATLNELSRHTGCPPACALGAALAVLSYRLTGAAQVELLLVNEGIEHRHGYDLDHRVSMRGLLGQRSRGGDARSDSPIRFETVDEADGVRLITDAVDGRMLDEVLPTLVHDALRSPDIGIDRLCLLADEQRAKVLHDWNQTARPYPSHQLVSDLVAAQAARTPYSVAVVDRTEVLSYLELDQRANRLARFLRRLEIGPGDLVGLHLGRTADLIVSMLAVLKAGAAYVPLDPRYPEARIGQMLDDSRAGLVLSDQTGAESAAFQDRRVVVLEAVRLLVEREKADEVVTGANADDLAYVIYTSGSTGRPKGVQIEHRNLTNLLLGMRDLLELTAEDSVLAVTSVSFDIAMLELLGPLVIGGKVAIADVGETNDGHRLLEALERSGATVMQATPASWIMLLDTGRWLPPITALCGGEAMPPTLARRLVGQVRQLWNVYGPTETTVWSTAARLTGTDWQAPSVGRPIANTRAYVLDDRMEPVPVGSPGELWLGGAGVARGYLGRLDLTDERFRLDPFQEGGRVYRTGDLARFRDDGALDILGRRDHQVKINGYRVELHEVERTLAEHPEVSRAVVATHATDHGLHRLVAYVVGGSLGELRRFLGERLPPYMVPTQFVFLDELPLLPNGKVDRAALAAAEPMAPGDEAGQTALDPDKPTAPTTTTEQTPPGLERLWRETLGVAHIGADDDFFALGGTSLQAGSLMNALERLTGDIVYVAAIFDHPTLSGFSSYLTAEYPRLAAALAHDGPGRPVTTQENRSVDVSMLRAFRRLVTGRPPAAPPDKLSKAAFVLSAPRSGSTLLRVMLAGHPELFVPPELELLGFDTMRARDLALSGRNGYAREGLLRALRQVSAGGLDEAETLVERLSQEHLVADTYRVLQEQIGPRLLVDKTSTYAMDYAALTRMEEMFEAPRYVHLIRHPGAMALSYVEARLDQVFRHEHSYSVRELAELIWLVSNQNVREFLHGVPGDRQMTVRFEDLLEEPVTVLRAIADFLDVPFHEAMLDPYADVTARMADGLHPESRMAGDFKFARFDKMEPSTANSWRTHFDTATLSPLTTVLARDYGYADLPAIRQSVRSAELGSHQRNVYLHQRLAGSSPLYNICKAWHLTGDVDELALRSALWHLVAGHEALRTTFHEAHGEVRQMVGEVGHAPLERMTLSPDSSEAEIQAVVESYAAGPLDLENGPLFRMLLVDLGPGRHVLAVLAHHAVIDGASLTVILRDLSQLYGAALEGREMPLPNGVQYIDTIDEHVQVRDEEYWRRTLSDVPALLALPSDKNRPSVKGHHGRRVRMTLPPPVLARIKEVAQSQGSTLYITLLAAFKALLMRYTEAAKVDKLVVGTAFANRQNPANKDVVGMLTGTLPLVTEVPAEPLTFRQLTGRVRDTCVGAFEHHDVPFEDLVRISGAGRDASYTPLVQIMFTFEPPLASELDLRGVQASGLLIDGGTAKFDLTVTCVPGENGLDGWWEYDTHLFDAEQVTRMVGHYTKLLHQIADDPDVPIDRIELLSTTEHDQVVRQWNTTDIHRIASESPITAIRNHAKRQPDAVAVEGDRAALTYAELNSASDNVAARLTAEGLRRGEIVAVLCGREPAFVVAALGIMKAGGAYLPIDPETPQSRIDYMLTDSGARWVLTTADLLLLIPETVTPLDIGTPSEDSEPIRLREPTGDELAYVIYTSGSTGHPKGVMIEHHSLENFVAWYAEEYRLTAADRCGHTANAAFDVCVMDVWPTLAVGATLVIAPAGAIVDPAKMWRWLATSRVTVSFVVTPLWEAMLVEPRLDDLALRTVVVAGDRLHPSPLRLPFQLVNGYGPTENTVLSTVETVRPSGDGLRPPAIGRPIAGTTAYILDAHRRPAPIGVEGELYLGGQQVARGYLNRPELTAERFVPDPFAGTTTARMFRTGDRVRHRADGAIEFLGRNDHQVKIRGFRIELGEIEAALQRIDEVNDAVVLALGAEHDRRLHAFFTGDSSLGRKELQRELARDLPSYMLPAGFTHLKAVPYTSNGKVDRRALETLAGTLPSVAAEPLDELEVALLELWRRILQTDVPVTGSFFEYGGHSLSAIRLASLVREKTGHVIGLPALFRAPSVREMAALLRTDRQSANLVRIQPDGHLPPLFCVHPSDGSVLAYAPLREICGPDQPVLGLQGETGPQSADASVESTAEKYVELVQAAWPSGPVQLLGWSFGGLIAFEMARQLEARGRTVMPLILLDSEVLTRPEGPENEARALREFAWQLRRGFERTPEVEADSPAAPHESRWSALIAHAVDAGWIEGRHAHELRTAYETFRDHLALGWRYVPEPITAAITLFTVSERANDRRKAQENAWRGLTTGDFAVVEITGDHMDVVSRPALRQAIATLPELPTTPGIDSGS